MRETVDIPPGCQGQLWYWGQQQKLSRSHHHAELEVNLIVRGRGTYLIEGRNVVLGAGAMLWLFPDRDHYLLETSAEFTRWCLVLRPEYLLRTSPAEGAAILGDWGDFGWRMLDAGQAAGLTELFKGLNAAKDSSERFNAGLVYALLTAWGLYQQGRAEPTGKGVHPAVAEAIAVVRRGDGGDGLGRVAQQVGLSAARLSRLFKSQTGISLTAFRNRCRIDRFLALYEGGSGQSMMQAALRAGFGSYAQFFRVFKRETGQAPAEYRRSRH